MEEDREGVDLDGAEEGVDSAELELVGAREASGSGSGDGDPAEGLAGVGGLETGLDQHDEDAGEGKDDLGEEGEDVMH